MGRHGTPDSDLAFGEHQLSDPHATHTGAPRAWDANAWDAAIAFDPADSLYASGDGYQAVNDWSGVYELPQQTAHQPIHQQQIPHHQIPQQQAHDAYYASPPAAGYGNGNAFYDYEAPPVAPAQPDQSYYESVYASYTATPAPEPVQPSPPAWDGDGSAAWHDPYAPAAFYGEQPTVQPQTYDYDYAGYEQGGYEQAGYEQAGYPEQVSFHDPTFDTGEFEAVYAAPDATGAAYDMLPEGDGYADEYADGYSHGRRYADADYADDTYADDADTEYDLDYEDQAEHTASDRDYDYDDSDETPLRSRSRTGGPGGAPLKSSPSSRTTGTRPAGRRTLAALAAAPAAVVGVAAVAVAAVGGMRLPTHTESATADPTPPSSGLEHNLLQMRAASADLASRATDRERLTEQSQQNALQKQRLLEMAPKYFLPVDVYALTAGFGDAGAHWSSLHTGQDFAVPTGTRVVSVADGVITETGWAGAFGKRVVITHADGSQTWYCHLSVIKVTSGPVKAGQLIAFSGDTGNSTGPHLHFEYHPPGIPNVMTGVPGATTAVDPMPFLRAHGLVP